MNYVEDGETIVDHLYEAATIPERWSGRGVLDNLAALCGCSDSAILSVYDQTLTGWAANEICAPKLEVYLRDNWFSQNPYILSAERQRLFSQPRFVLDTEVMSAEEMMASPYYQGFMRPYGVFWHAGTNIVSPSGDTIKLSVHRSFEAGPLDPRRVDRLNTLRPHIARACLITARLRFAQLHAAVEVLDAVGLPGAALRNGRLAVCNKRFEKLLPVMVLNRHERVTFQDKSADASWARISAQPASSRCGTFPVAATEEFPITIVHVLPIAGSSRDIFPAADTLMIMASSDGNQKADPEVLLSLFDFTAAEVAVTNGLLHGMPLTQIAEKRGVSPETVKGQLKSIFSKTGTNRQPDLVRLLGGIANATSMVR